MRIGQIVARASNRAKTVIAAPRRRAAAEMIGSLVLGALLLCLIASAVNTPRKQAS
jgi:hypothetical protein